MMFLYINFLLMSLLYCVRGTSNGALAGACSSMEPSHSSTRQTSAAPFQLTVDKTSYKGGETVTVTLAKTSNVQFKGYLIQARNQNDEIIPGFALAGTAKFLTCSTTNDAVTHSEASLKDTLSLTFSAPTMSRGNITMYATVVQTKAIYWVKIPSTTISDSVSVSSITAISKLTLVAVFICMFSL